MRCRRRDISPLPVQIRDTSTAPEQIAPEVVKRGLGAEKRDDEIPCPSGITGENGYQIKCNRPADHCGCHIGTKADGFGTSWND